MSATRIAVTGAAPYEVVIGHGLLGELPAALGDGVQRVAIIHPAALRLTGEGIQKDLQDNGFQAIVIEVPDAEQAKSIEVLGFCWTVLGQSGFTRSDAIVSVGGGATTDLAGFVAASWLRGVKVVHVPTTLLGMVDAAVGGKTGINTAEGKNLVGAFHEPTGVICDLNTLETLPGNDFVAGLAEVIKCGFIADEQILRLIESDFEQAKRHDGTHTRELVERAISVKAQVVSNDLRESTTAAGARVVGREILNYGHTFGHAIEKVERYRWRHGSAISVGMVFVAELARMAGRLDDAVVNRHREILGGVGLPLEYPAGRWDALHDAMRVDKKSRGDRLRFVVLDDVAKPVLLDSPDPSLVLAAYDEISTDTVQSEGVLL